jgi:hypothetical protein
MVMQSKLNYLYHNVTNLWVFRRVKALVLFALKNGTQFYKIMIHYQKAVECVVAQNRSSIVRPCDTEKTIVS